MQPERLVPLFSEKMFYSRRVKKCVSLRDGGSCLNTIEPQQTELLVSSSGGLGVGVNCRSSSPSNPNPMILLLLLLLGNPEERIYAVPLGMSKTWWQDFR